MVKPMVRLSTRHGCRMGGEAMSRLIEGRIRQHRSSIRWVAAGVVAVFGVAGVALRSAPAERGRVIPPPLVDESTGGATSEVAVLAGGCFWGVQGVFQHVKGVTSAVSGYAGGRKNTAHYEAVGQGDSGHAESVQVTFDPRQVSYGRLLQIFFSVAHDPTQVNRQGPDVGTQYRSAVFPAGDEQASIAKAYIAQLNDAHVFAAPIATRIEMNSRFFAAEDYHQDFLTRHPTSPYIVVNDLPKIGELKRVFPDLYRSDPVLVGGTR
jgi:peptide-methionine (S)-S-oxide reductase